MAKSSQVGSRSLIKETVQEMFQQGFDEKYNVPAFEVLEEDVSQTPNVLRRKQAELKLTVKMEYSGSNPIYIGEAKPGTATSSAGWRIRKLTYSGENVTDIEWADGDIEFNNIWDNRDSLSYS